MKKTYSILALLFLTITACGQTQTERLTDARQSIIGVWVNESDSNYKIEFNSRNRQLDFVDGELQETVSTYEISDHCGQSGNNNFDIYLKRVDNSGVDYCDVINNISVDPNGRVVLSITNDRGKLQRFIKQ